MRYTWKRDGEGRKEMIKGLEGRGEERVFSDQNCMEFIYCLCVRVRVCARARVRARACACVCVCVCL